MISNKRRATLNSLIWGTALWDRLFLHFAVLFFTNVPRADYAQNALHSHKNGRIAMTTISVNRP